MSEKTSPCRIRGQWCETHQSHAEDGDTKCRQAQGLQSQGVTSIRRPCQSYQLGDPRKELP